MSIFRKIEHGNFEKMKNSQNLGIIFGAVPPPTPHSKFFFVKFTLVMSKECSCQIWFNSDN